MGFLSLSQNFILFYLYSSFKKLESGIVKTILKQADVFTIFEKLALLNYVNKYFGKLNLFRTA
jgi:hypothetical protein